MGGATESCTTAEYNESKSSSCGGGGGSAGADRRIPGDTGRLDGDEAAPAGATRMGAARMGAVAGDAGPGGGSESSDKTNFGGGALRRGGRRPRPPPPAEGVPGGRGLSGGWGDIGAVALLGVVGPSGAEERTITRRGLGETGAGPLSRAEGDAIWTGFPICTAVPICTALPIWPGSTKSVDEGSIESMKTARAGSFTTLLRTLPHHGTEVPPETVEALAFSVSIANTAACLSTGTRAIIPLTIWKVNRLE
mmetsp:Transcript_13550/g.31201  ORF Transcript_13550/g.31201 Transcript_13550/m.31201 type:complete len:251 (-) Transcript_13550:823-1575(-)